MAEKLVAAIQSFVDEKESQVTETLDVPTTKHRELIGSGGSVRKRLEQNFNVTINIPAQGSGQTGVKISGRPENVAKVKEHIDGITARSEGETIMVPRALHHIISRNGALFRELSRDGVRVDHKGEKQPPKPKDSNRAPRGRTTNGDMPLITDQPGQESYTWDIASNQVDLDGESGEIPWVISCGKNTPEASVTKAKQKIESSLAKAREPQHTGYLILPDPRLHRHIVGPGGATINSIRKATGCDIQVPNRNSTRGEDGEAVTIVGQEAGVLSARDLILEEIKRAEAGRSRA